MKKKIIVGILIIIIIICIVIANKYLRESKNMNIQYIIIANKPASYEFFDRNIKIDYFYNLSADTTYEEIVNEIGKPNGMMGSGIMMPYYKADDQYIALWFGRDEEGEYTKISQMFIYTSDTYVGEIPLNETREK